MSSRAEKQSQPPFRRAASFFSGELTGPWWCGLVKIRILVFEHCEGVMAKTLSLSEVKTRLPELVAGVQEREEEVVVTKNGRPAAVLINVDEYTRLKETLDVLSDPVLMKQIGRSKSFYRTGRKDLAFEDVFGEPFTPVKKRRTA